MNIGGFCLSPSTRCTVRIKRNEFIQSLAIPLMTPSQTKDQQLDKCDIPKTITNPANKGNVGINTSKEKKEIPQEKRYITRSHKPKNQSQRTIKKSNINSSFLLRLLCCRPLGSWRRVGRCLGYATRLGFRCHRGLLNHCRRLFRVSITHFHCNTWSHTAVGVLRGRAVLALGFVAVFFLVVAVVAFLAVLLAAGFSAFSVVSLFLVAVFLGAALAGAAFYSS